jgi:hypothetical protein
VKDFPEYDKRGNPRTPWAVYCEDDWCEEESKVGCGLFYLTEDAYEWQCAEGSSIFYCPICEEVAEFLDVKPPARPPGFEVQTRSKSGELRFFPSLKEAFAHAETDDQVWKISFAVESGERVRLVRQWRLPSTVEPRSNWVYENILDEVLKQLKKEEHNAQV